MPSKDARRRTETLPALRLARADRREDLLEATAQLVVEKGVEGVSMESVAERAGVSRPLVYKHFANRSEMLTELYRLEAIGVGREVSEAVREAASVEAKYRALVHAALGASARRGALLQALRSAGAFNRELRHEQRDQDRRTVRYFAEQTTQELGIPAPDAEAVSGMLLTALDSVLGQYRARRTPATARLLEETYMDMVTATLERVRRREPAAVAESV